MENSDCMQVCVMRGRIRGREGGDIDQVLVYILMRGWRRMKEILSPTSKPNLQG